MSGRTNCQAKLIVKLGNFFKPGKLSYSADCQAEQIMVAKYPKFRSSSGAQSITMLSLLLVLEGVIGNQ